MIRRAATFLIVLTAIALFAPVLAPYSPADAYRDFMHAPPMAPYLEGLSPRVHPVVLADRLEQRFEPDASRSVKLPWVERNESAPVFRSEEHTSELQSH